MARDAEGVSPVLRRRAMVVVLATVLLDAVAFGIVIPMLPLYAASMSASKLAVGAVLACFSGAQFLATPALGALSDRVGRRPVIVLSLGGSVAAMLLFAGAVRASSLWVLVVSRLLAGATAGNLSACQAAIADVTPPERRASAMGVIGAGLGLGLMAGPAIGAALSGRLGPEGPPVGAGVMSVFALALALLLMPETLGREPGVLAEPSPTARPRPPFRQVLAERRMLTLLAITFAAFVAMTSVQTALPLLTQERLGWSSAQIGYGFAGFGVVLLLVQGVLVGRLVRVVRETPLLALGLLLETAGLLCISLGSQSPLVITGSALMGVGIGITNPVLSTLASSLARPDQQGAVLGVAQSTGSLARTIGPLFSGLLYQLFGAGAPFAGGAAATAAGLMLALELRRLANPLTEPPRQLLPRELMRPRRVVAALLSLLALASCTPQAATSLRNANDQDAPIDPWDQIPKTAEWVFVTGGHGGDHDAECKEVYQWVDGEQKCSSGLCHHARDLTGEWLARCRSKMPAEAKKIDEVYKDYQLRAREAPSECAQKAETIVEKGCGNEDRTCKEAAEAWSTQCGKEHGTPLVMLILSRAVERRSPPGTHVELDSRDCATLKSTLLEGAKCTQRKPCEEAAREVTIYRRRCQQGGELPTLATALVQAAIAGGAEYAPQPIAFRATSPRVTVKDFPVVTEDGSAAVLYVCDQRVTDAKSAFSARKSCKNGKLMLAKAFVKEGSAEVRVGQLEFPSDAEFAARFPGLKVAGEGDLRDKEAIAAFASEVDKASAGSPQDAMKALVKLANAQASSLRRSAAFRAALKAKDDALVGAMRELGKLKAKANSPRTPPLDLLGLGLRATRRPFADVSVEGALAIGQPTAASELETGEMLPHATAAYEEAARAVMTTARRTKIDEQTANITRSYAIREAESCASAEKQVQAAEQSILECGFSGCSADKLDELKKQAEEARAAAALARHQWSLAAYGPAYVALSELQSKLSGAGCAPPWW